MSRFPPRRIAPLSKSWRARCPALSLKDAVSTAHAGLVPGREGACDLDWTASADDHSQTALAEALGEPVPPPVAIRVPRLGTAREAPHEALAHLCAAQVVPEGARFSLFAAVRQARLMSSREGRLLAVHSWLAALFVLFSCALVNYEGVQSLVTEESGFAQEIVALLGAELDCPAHTRALALRSVLSAAARGVWLAWL